MNFLLEIWASFPRPWAWSGCVLETGETEKEAVLTRTRDREREHFEHMAHFLSWWVVCNSQLLTGGKRWGVTMRANQKSLEHMSEFRPLHPCLPEAFFSSKSTQVRWAALGEQLCCTYRRNALTYRRTVFLTYRRTKIPLMMGSD